MNRSHKPERELITGMGGSGKTTLWLSRLKQNKARWKFVYDWEGEMALALGCLPATNLAEISRQLQSGGVCFFDPDKICQDAIAGFEAFCDFIFELAPRLPGVKLLACDELQDVAGIDVAHYVEINGTSTQSYYFKRLMERGRRREIDVLAISQAPNALHNRVRNQFYRVTTFMHTDKNALKFLIEAGHNAEEVRALLPGQYISRNKRTGDTDRGEVFKAA